MNKLYILHEFGSNSHYRALSWASKKYEAFDIEYREFSVVRKSAKAFLHGNFALFRKQFINAFFIISLLFTKGKKVIVGIAPYDWRLILYYPLLKRHTYYYHTSKTTWGYQNYSKKFLAHSQLSKRVWKKFIEGANGVFCVTEKTVSELNKYYQVKNIHVVNHAIPQEYKINSINFSSSLRPLKCLFVGRLETCKGLEVIFDLVRELDPALFDFSFIGDGEMTEQVKLFASENENCNYLGMLKNPELMAQYDMNDILLAPSIKTGPWEELFGMVLIEAMSRGVVPIATDHSGPKEIIENSKTGFIFNEDQYLLSTLEILRNISNERLKLVDLKKQAFTSGQSYTPDQIFKKWNTLLQIKV